jgi:dTDP-glucose pyrophosphorylase
VREIDHLLVAPGTSIRHVTETIDAGRAGIALVADERGRLIATVTDGDIRRAILASVDFDAPVEVLRDQQEQEPYPTPLTAPADTGRAELLEVMSRYGLRHVPLVDADGAVVELALLQELLGGAPVPGRAIIMAGGFGTRLGELTESVPKPMLPVGDRPLLEHIVRRLREAGLRSVVVATHYLGDVIRDHFGDGSRFGVEMQYLTEDEPLGTAGALALLPESDEPLLVVNGDILSHVDYGAMLQFHHEHDADLTVAVAPYEVGVPFGVLETDGLDVVGVSEKPVLSFFVNAGIYVLEPAVRTYVPAHERSDMTDLVQRLLDDGRRVIGFPVREYWLDIGHAHTYEQAQRDTLGRP